VAFRYQIEAPKVLGVNIFLDTNVVANPNLRDFIVAAEQSGLCRLSISDFVISEWGPMVASISANPELTFDHEQKAF